MDPPFPGSARAGAVSAAPEENGNLWICGGESSEGVMSDCYRHDAESGVWTPGMLMHSPRAFAASTMTQSGQWHVTGGVDQ